MRRNVAFGSAATQWTVELNGAFMPLPMIAGVANSVSWLCDSGSESLRAQTPPTGCSESDSFGETGASGVAALGSWGDYVATATRSSYDIALRTAVASRRCQHSA
eukprot:1859230-Prymnesium_polylepis.2